MIALLRSGGISEYPFIVYFLVTCLLGNVLIILFWSAYLHLAARTAYRERKRERENNISPDSYPYPSLHLSWSVSFAAVNSPYFPTPVSREFCRLSTLRQESWRNVLCALLLVPRPQSAWCHGSPGLARPGESPTCLAAGSSLQSTNTRWGRWQSFFSSKEDLF